MKPKKPKFDPYNYKRFIFEGPDLLEPAPPEKKINKFLHEYEKFHCAPEYAKSWRKQRREIEQKLEDGYEINYDAIRSEGLGKEDDFDYDDFYVEESQGNYKNKEQAIKQNDKSGGIQKLSTIMYKKKL